jgi:hypothetical protein
VKSVWSDIDRKVTAAVVFDVFGTVGSGLESAWSGVLIDSAQTVETTRCGILWAGCGWATVWAIEQKRGGRWRLWERERRELILGCWNLKLKALSVFETSVTVYQSIQLKISGNTWILSSVAVTAACPCGRYVARRVRERQVGFLRDIYGWRIWDVAAARRPWAKSVAAVIAKFAGAHSSNLQSCG